MSLDVKFKMYGKFLFFVVSCDKLIPISRTELLNFNLIYRVSSFIGINSSTVYCDFSSNLSV